jgi:hypothetical protein
MFPLFITVSRCVPALATRTLHFRDDGDGEGYEEEERSREGGGGESRSVLLNRCIMQFSSRCFGIMERHDLFF